MSNGEHGERESLLEMLDLLKSFSEERSDHEGHALNCNCPQVRVAPQNEDDTVILIMVDGVITTRVYHQGDTHESEFNTMLESNALDSVIAGRATTTLSQMLKHLTSSPSFMSCMITGEVYVVTSVKQTALCPTLRVRDHVITLMENGTDSRFKRHVTTASFEFLDFIQQITHLTQKHLKFEDGTNYPAETTDIPPDGVDTAGSDDSMSPKSYEEGIVQPRAATPNAGDPPADVSEVNAGRVPDESA